MKKRYGVLPCIVLFCGCADYVDGTVTETRTVEGRWAGKYATYSGPEYDVTFDDATLTFEGDRKLGEVLRLLRDQVEIIRAEQKRRDDEQARQQRYEDAAKRSHHHWEQSASLMPLAD